MTTGYPILEQIAQAIETRLGNVTTANGYQQSVSVKRPKRMGDNWTPEDALVLITQGNAARNNEVEQNQYPMIFGWDQDFRIEIFTIPSESDPTPIEQLANTVYADVLTAITDPVATWHTWGDLAIFSDITDVEMQLADDGSAHLTTITLTVTYRTPSNNPYTAA